MNKDFDFDSVYLRQCTLESATPLANIRTMARSKFVEIEAEKLQQCDWNALLNTLTVNKDMEKISIQNIRAVENFYKTDKPPTHRSAKKQLLPINEPVTVRRLVRSLTGLISYNKSLTVLRLEGISFNKGHLSCIFQFLMSSEMKLKTLSFAYCNVGDECVKIILEGLHDSITLLNLSGCALTNDTVSLLCSVIRSHAVRRHDEAWRHTLRYQMPNFDRMNCLRRLTLNDNPKIDDEGIKFIAATLENDVWVKAVDLQRCGITVSGAQTVLDMLRLNTSLFVVDIRENNIIDSTIMDGIYEQLKINCGNGQSSFKWMDISPIAKSQKMLRNKPHVDSHNKIYNKRGENSSEQYDKLQDEIAELKLQLKNSRYEKKELCEQLSHLFNENTRLEGELSKHTLLTNNEFLTYIDDTFRQFNVFFSSLNGYDTPQAETQSVIDTFRKKMSNQPPLNDNEESKDFKVENEEFGETENIESESSCTLEENKEEMESLTTGSNGNGDYDEYSNDFIDDSM